MKFYVPEWDDAVDARYDFEHDELSTLNRQERELDYIWDIFDKSNTPIDGVLISREQVESTKRKADRLTNYGVYDDPVLSVPEWLPTISDCGAWGYKSLPFPPYGNKDMLEFYETLDVSVGVTIDHLVLGSGKDKGRLYLDERAFSDEFDQGDIPETISDVVDVMIDEWPDDWPSYVDEYEPSIRTEDTSEISSFDPELFRGDIDAVLESLDGDPRAVYREHDAEFRFDLTLRNAREMYMQYQDCDYSFRLMVAIQGWNLQSYKEATEEVLDFGYDYLGIGGVAGSPIHEVRKIVKSVGKTVKRFERANNTRIDSHVFGFAKTDGFDAIGRSGMTTFDSASMLRSAWTGGDNYQLDSNERYDAVRVRYPSNRDSIEEAVEKSLRGRETLVALRAYAANEPIEGQIQDWHDRAEDVLSNTRAYLQSNRHDDRYDQDLLNEVEEAFRSDFRDSRELQASFSDRLRGKLVKLLRKDSPENPISFDDYDELLRAAEGKFANFPRVPSLLADAEHNSAYDQVWIVVRDYAMWVGDESLLEEYQETLKNRPWEKCNCTICEEHGVEICIFRGNDRNRRRGFHNTRRFYDQFTQELPKIMVATRGTASLGGSGTIENYLRSNHRDFWSHSHDLPVAEIGVLHAGGIQEWWDDTPTRVSFGPNRMAENLGQQMERYQHLFLMTPNGEIDSNIAESVAENDCEIHTFDDPDELREAVLTTCGRDYVVGDDFVPHAPEIDLNDDLKVLVIDQCSGSKEYPEGSPVFGESETLACGRDELLKRDNVPAIAAKDLYTGRQQGFVREAVRQMKDQGHDADRYFISAGFGLVKEDELLPPYEATFGSMNVGTIRERSDQLSIQEDLREILTQAEYDIVFFTLGSDYYTSINIDEIVQEIPADRIGIVFNRELVDDQFENIVSVPARTEDAKNHGKIVVELKGYYLKNFAKRLHEVDVLEPETIEALCRRVCKKPDQSEFEKFERP